MSKNNINIIKLISLSAIVLCMLLLGQMVPVQGLSYELTEDFSDPNLTSWEILADDWPTLGKLEKSNL